MRNAREVYLRSLCGRRGFLARYRLCMQMLMRCGERDGTYEKYSEAEGSAKSWVQVRARAGRQLAADAEELNAEGLDETFH